MEKKKMSKGRRIRMVIAVVVILAIIVAAGPLIFFVQNLSNANDGSYQDVPTPYKKEAQTGGTIIALEYTARQAEDSTKEYNKTAYVYLPHGYGDTKKYNILYFMHGAGESATSLIRGEGKKSETKNIIDNMIANGDIEPMIIVVPTIYNGDEEDGRSLNGVLGYDYELLHCLIPAVENQFSTYAENTDLQGLKASREHRAFGGYSMGSMTTWHIFSTCLDYIKWYIPMSGDCADAEGRLKATAEDKAAFLNEVVEQSGYENDDFFIYCFIGGIDSAYPRFVPQFREMLKEEAFIYGDDISEGNLYLSIKTLQIHDMKTSAPGALYNALPTIFCTD